MRNEYIQRYEEIKQDAMQKIEYITRDKSLDPETIEHLTEIYEDVIRSCNESIAKLLETKQIQQKGSSATGTLEPFLIYIYFRTKGEIMLI